MTVEARPTAALFSDLAEPYDRFSRTLGMPEASVSRWLDRHLGSGARALDVGCGTGRYTALLADRFDEVIGVDAAPGMIEIATQERARANIRYETQDVLAFTAEEHGLFDVVLAFSFVLHVGTPDVVLAHLRTLVAPGGHLVIVEPQRPPTWGQPGWQADLAFMSARAAYGATSDVEDAITALKLVLSPEWLRISEISVPLTREELFEQYAAALPGVAVDEGGELLGYFAASWRAPEA